MVMYSGSMCPPTLDWNNMMMTSQCKTMLYPSFIVEYTVHFTEFVIKGDNMDGLPLVSGGPTPLTADQQYQKGSHPAGAPPMLIQA